MLQITYFFLGNNHAFLYQLIRLIILCIKVLVRLSKTECFTRYFVCQSMENIKYLINHSMFVLHNHTTFKTFYVECYVESIDIKQLEQFHLKKFNCPPNLQNVFMQENSSFLCRKISFDPFYILFETIKLSSETFFLNLIVSRYLCIK